MIQILTRFLTLLLVLLSIGAFDLQELRGRSEESLSPLGFIPAASALPATREHNRKPRIGIVLTTGQSLKVASPKSAKVQAESPFSDDHGRVGMSVSLKRLEHPPGSNPLMLYQHHINKANNKLAAMFNRNPLTKEQLKESLERRKLSILARRSIGFQARATTCSTLAPPSRRSGHALPQASPVIGRRFVKPRLGFTKVDANTPVKRLVIGFLSVVLGGGNEAKPKKVSAVTTMSDGYPKAAYEASTKSGLYDASSPAVANSFGLGIEANDIGYVITVKIGSDKLPFRLLVDSGSADTWVPSTKCTNCSTKHQRLGKSTSSTFKGINEKFSITYGTGKVSGRLASDSLTIADMELKNHTMGLAKKESEEFNDDSVPFEGLMGLAKSELSIAGVPTPIDALYDAGLVSAPVMGYHLGRVSDGFNDGQVTFGGVDSARFNGTLLEIPNVSKQGFWEASVDSIKFDGKDLGLNARTAILDTGTSLIVAPKEDADKLHAAIPGSKSDGQGGYTIPCTTVASVSFTIKGKKFDIDPRDMIFLPVDGNDLTGDCASSVSSGQVGLENEWLVGATFLKNVYFATNAKTNTIGLARL